MIKKIFSSTLVKSSGIYAITNILNSAIPFFLLPILTRYLTPEEYGLVAMIGVLVGLTSPFVGINTHGAITRKYYDRDSIKFTEYVGNCLFILFSSTLLVSVFYFLFRDFISEYTEIPIKWLWIVLLIAFSQYITKVNLTLWIVQVKSLSYGVFQISNTAVKFSLAILLVVVFKLGWKGQVGALGLSAFLFASISMIILIKDKWVLFKPNLEYLRNALKFGSPLIPHAISMFIISATDRLFITNMVGVDQTGLYVVGYQLGIIVNVIAESFHKAWTPWLFDILKNGNEKQKLNVVKVSYLYIIGLILLAFIISFLSPLLFGFFIADTYEGAIKFIFWIALGYSFNGIYRIYVDYIFYNENTKVLALLTFSIAIINIGLNYVLISTIGVLGAAVATTIIYLLKGIAVYIYARRTYPMPKLAGFL